jgi:hypothetical protein
MQIKLLPRIFAWKWRLVLGSYRKKLSILAQLNHRVNVSDKFIFWGNLIKDFSRQNMYYLLDEETNDNLERT